MISRRPPSKIEWSDLQNALMVSLIHKDWTRGVAAVLGVLLKHLNLKTGQCNPSIDRISRMANIDRSTVKRSLKFLHRAEILRSSHSKGRGHTPNYSFNWKLFRTLDSQISERGRAKTGGAGAPFNMANPFDLPHEKGGFEAREKGAPSGGMGRTDAPQTLLELKYKNFACSHRSDAEASAAVYAHLRASFPKDEMQRVIEADVGLIERATIAERSSRGAGLKLLDSELGSAPLRTAVCLRDSA